MNDHLLVEALRERDHGAMAAVYDAHAHRLYAYCWFQLRCRDTAQVALRDTFIVAEAHIDELRDPDRFRAWLYAIARLECARRMPPKDRVPDVRVASHDQEDVDQRVTAWQAVLAMRPASRELLELAVRHRLPLPDLAAVLGLSLRDAQEASDLAQDDLEVALAAQILVQQGPYGCAERAQLLRERCGELVHDLSERLVEHARACPVCGAFRPRTVSAKKVYSLLPDARPRADLRLRVMSCFLDPELVGYRLFVATRVTDFASDGFPLQDGRSRRQARPRGGGFWLGRHRKRPSETQDAGPGAQVVRAAVVLTVVALLSAGGVASMYGLVGTAKGPAGTASGRQPTAMPGLSQTPEAERSPGTRPEGPETFDPAPVSATFPLGARASAAPPVAMPAPPPVPVSGTESTVARGSLTVSPLFLDLAGGSDSSIELRAEGGPVPWQAKAQGAIRVQPSSGLLQAGQTMAVHVHVSRRPDARGEGTVTFAPSSTKVHVTWRQDAPPTTGPSPMPTGSGSASPSMPPETHRPGGPGPTPSEPQGPGDTRPTPSPSPTPAPTPPSGDPPESTPPPTGRSSGSTSQDVSPTSSA
ncbi:RNA polymerase sigma factor [Actinomadura monticuli]|uniref:Sigma-70 family RNA polymerase sigma factor n=1 Tax=Actinomadura monticuli TaxID=3097367 RepID=A0ABV4QJ50_9ACTN